MSPDGALGRYRLLGPIGRGASGEVFEAVDPTLDRPVAIKILRGELTGTANERLRREALALARLSHPNVVQVHEVGVVDGRTFIVMELVRGQTLDQWQRRPQTWRHCLEVYRQAGAGLAAAHDEGIVHRDFKPHNCILGDDGRVRVLDFGLASEPGRVSVDPTREQEPLEASLTQTGAIMGTPAYMPLEQFDGKPASAASDQFSFCVSLFEALYGERPFAARGVGRLVVALRRGEVRIPRGARVPGGVRRVILRGLQWQPSRRWPSMEDLLRELGRVERRRRESWVMGAVAVGLTASFTAGLWLSRNDDEPCRNPAAALEGTWSVEDKQAVQEVFQRFDGTASTAFVRVEEKLDGYAQDWVSMYESSCRATYVTHRQSEHLFDQRMLCLQRRRNRLHAVIEALAEAQSKEELTNQIVLPFKLPPMQDCADLERLTNEQPLPDDIEVRERVGELRKEIDRANTLNDAFDMEGALRVIEPVVKEARSLGYLPVLAESLWWKGRLQASGASATKAEQTLHEAISVAARAGDEHSEAGAWISLLHTVTRQHRTEEGQLLELAARAAVDRAGDELLLSWLLNNLGNFHGEHGEYELALDYLHQAIEIKTRTLGEEHWDVAVSWVNLGNTLAHMRKNREAKEAFEHARSILDATVGTDHPTTSFVLQGMCKVELAQGNAEAAVDLCSQVLRSFETTPTSPTWVGRVSFALAQAQWAAGQHEQARKTAQQAKATIEEEDPATVEQIDQWLLDPDAAQSSTADDDEPDGGEPDDAESNDGNEASEDTRAEATGASESSRTEEGSTG